MEMLVEEGKLPSSKIVEAMKMFLFLKALSVAKKHVCAAELHLCLGDDHSSMAGRLISVKYLRL